MGLNGSKIVPARVAFEEKNTKGTKKSIKKRICQLMCCYPGDNEVPAPESVSEDDCSWGAEDASWGTEDASWGTQDAS